ncbi:MAG: recombinase family protein [Paracoccaceae bacterium]|nr:recombinase family protein [Paracoccaceae bacterium]
MQIGYARVSTADQSVDSQVAALSAAGCDRVFEETASGAKADRRVLAEVLDYLRPDDAFVVFKLDRVARSLPHLLEIMETLKSRGIGFQSLTEEINTTTPGGKLLFHVMAAIAEFERDLIRERTMHGLKAARAKGRVGGRPRQMTDNKIEAARTLLQDGTPVRDVANMLSVSVPTIYRWIPGATR